MRIPLVYKQKYVQALHPHVLPNIAP